jgi:hypothetical protein
MEEEENQIQISASASTVHAGSYKNKESFVRVMAEQAEEERILTGDNAVDVDLSGIRGIPPPNEEDEQEEQERIRVIHRKERDVNRDEELVYEEEEEEEEEDLEGLAELVPELKTSKSPPRLSNRQSDIDTTTDESHLKISHADSTITNRDGEEEDSTENALHNNNNNNNNSSKHAFTMDAVIEEQDDNEESEDDEESESSEVKTTNELIQTYHEGKKDGNHHDTVEKVSAEEQPQMIQDDASSSSGSSSGHTHTSNTPKDVPSFNNEPPLSQHHPTTIDRSNPKPYHQTTHQRDLSPPPHEQLNDESFMTNQKTPSPTGRNNYQPQSSAASLSTTTQSAHEVRMPMFLPNFRPATGCTNASDFVVRCFVARLRAGITVVKHGRSRWCKSRLR